MLQIVTGKFFGTGKLYETLHRGAYYTNYRAIDGLTVETTIGRLLVSTGFSGVGTLTYELLEKIEGPESQAGVMTSTGGRELVEDFAAVLSFILNVVCTTEFDTARRLTAGSAADISSGMNPEKYLRRVFDARVISQPEDAVVIKNFVESLIGLERASYENAIRAIRRYVTATHRIADDTNLAYALFVMSIESLAQADESPVAQWSDYDEGKRARIDKALADAPEDLAERVRSAVLENEHIAISRRFRDFAIHHISPAFFREEAVEALAPISRPDLLPLLRRAYELRSAYVHRLHSLPKSLFIPLGPVETFEIDGQPALTFQGLARIARHIIIQFIQRAPKVEREAFNWWSALPNVLRMRLDPKHWISRPEEYTPLTARHWLESFIAQAVTPSVALSDLTGILDKIENHQLGTVKLCQRRAMLTLYHLFILLAGPNYERPRHGELLKRYERDFSEATVEELAVILVTGTEFPWSLEAVEKLHEYYWSTRRHKGALLLGNLLEATFTLRLAELNRVDGRETRTEELISFAVEAFPGNAAILALERMQKPGPRSPIDVRKILLQSNQEDQVVNSIEPENQDSKS